MHEPWTDESTFHPDAESLVEVLKPWLLLALALGCFLLDQAILWVAWSAASLRVGLLVASVLGVVGPTLVTGWMLGLPLAGGLSIHRPSRTELLLTGWVGVSALAPVYMLGVIGARWFPPADDAFDFYEALLPGGPGSVLLGGLGVVILAPLAEEVLFRLLVQGALVRLVPAGAAVLTTAVVFAASHASWWILLPILLLALLLGFLMWRTSNLADTWLVHGMFNLVAYWDLCVTGDVRATRLEGLALDPRVLVPSSVSLVAAVWALWRWHGDTPAAIRADGDVGH